MKTPPSVRGGVPVRVASLFFGLFLCSVGIICLLQSKLGLLPWDVLHQGIARHTPLSFGEANIAVGVAVLVAAWLLGARVGFGTVANATLIGVFVQAVLSSGAVDGLTEEPLAARVGLLALGLACWGIGSAFYIGAALGAGPRDSLMLVASRRTGIRIGAVRGTLELAALGTGIALGGTFGIGTVASALLVGPLVEASFWLLGRSPLAAPPAAAVAD